MNYQQALEFIHSNFWQGSKPGLSRTEDLLNRMGDPQKKLKFVHVAGTNGKGSFCAMLTQILIKAGYRVGTYTSPYILRFNERMKVNGVDIPDKVLATLTENIRPLTEQMAEKPTEFELITAIAMEYFKNEACDVVVLECGMGGRLDSTNVIDTPILSVITGIAKDHTAFLGDTIEEIAFEKAGIIKKQIPILYCGKEISAENVIRKKAEEMEAPFFMPDRKETEIFKMDLHGTDFSYRGWKNIHLSLLGNYQVENAQNVLNAVLLLREKGMVIPDDAVLDGMKEVSWPARYEAVCRDPLILCDGGHNPEGVDSAVQSTKKYFADKKLVLVTGVMADKDYAYMVRRLSEIADEAFCIKPENPRALSAKELCDEFGRNEVSATPCASPEEAVKKAVASAKEKGSAILCVGSLYMYGEIRRALEKIL